MRRYAAGAALLSVLLGTVACGPGLPTLPTTPAPPEYRRYVAMGDSYSAAPGVRPSKPNVCLRSRANYPSLLATGLDVRLVDRTCSAAAIDDLTTSQGAGVGPQLDGLTPKTDLVTLSIGANPTLTSAWFWGCGSVAAQAPKGAPCRAAMQTASGDRLVNAIATEKVELTAVVKEIRRRAPDARLVLVGYPQVFPTSGTCPDRLPFAAGDLPYADLTLRRLNTMIEQVAEAQDADYADVYAATRGHDICAKDPWIQGRENEQGGALFYHPRAAEQKAVAGLLLDLLR